MSKVQVVGSRGAEVRARIVGLRQPHKYPGNVKSLMLIAYMDIALEHHAAIWLLRESELTGSAFAMVRLVHDAFLRALWVNAVATEDEIEQASRDEFKFPPMQKMRDDIKERYGDAANPEQMQLLDQLLQRLKEAWRVMSSYTHSGGRQIAQRFTFDEVKPNYSDGDTARTLNLATMALLLLARMFFMSMGRQREAAETKNMIIEYSAAVADAISY